MEYSEIYFKNLNPGSHFYEVQVRATGGSLGTVYMLEGRWRLIFPPASPLGQRYTTRRAAVEFLLRYYEQSLAQALAECRRGAYDYLNLTSLGITFNAYGMDYVCAHFGRGIVEEYFTWEKRAGLLKYPQYRAIDEDGYVVQQGHELAWVLRMLDIRYGAHNGFRFWIELIPGAGWEHFDIGEQ